MSEARETVRRIERQREQDWRAEYAKALPPRWVEPTPDCTCDWVDIRNFDGVVWMTTTRYDPDCPDHTPPEVIP